MTEETAKNELEAADAAEAINEAADYANQSIAAGDAGTEAPMRMSELTPEERAIRMRYTARLQREMGAQELDRRYRGAMVVPTDIRIGDTHIASSSLRFLGLTDRTLFILNRYGTDHLDAAEFDQVQNALSELIESYINEGKQSLEQGQELLKKRKEMADLDGEPWFSPEYSTTALDIQFDVKSRLTLSLVQAVHNWDKAILEFGTLDFNGGGDAQQVETLRRRERRLFREINRMCVRIVRSLGARNRAAMEARLEAEKAFAEGRSSARETAAAG